MNPLLKRLPREFAHNLGKYLGLFVLMVFAIAVVSGFLVAAQSIKKIEAAAYDTYVIEDFRFATQFEAAQASIDAVEDLGATVYENFSSDVAFDLADGTSGTVRLYQNREQVDLAAYVAGEAPTADDQIALDRVFCNNHGLSVGDTVMVAGREMTLSGIMTLGDYWCLMEKDTDFMFNAMTFTVAQVTQEAYEELSGGKQTFTYSVRFDDRSLSLAERTSLENDAAQALTEKGETVTALTDREGNSAISFVSGDVESDMTMWEVLFVILIAIMAFVFVVLTDATIESESAVIGTLLASGWRTRELIAHYMILPCVVGVLAGALGNVLGYTLMSDPMQALYYNSYSLPPYSASFELGVFLFTTVLPIALLAFITWYGLRRKLSATPLAFLRHEVGRTSRRSNLRLPERMSYTGRFRLRIFARNAPHFAVLFLGLMFGSVLLLFGVCLMPTVRNYVAELKDDVVAEHVYFLKGALELTGSDEDRAAWDAYDALSKTEHPLDVFTSDEIKDMTDAINLVGAANAHPVNDSANSQEAIDQAEKITAASLQCKRAIGADMEDVTVYGIQEGSAYWPDLDVGERQVYVGRGLASKCDVKVGDRISLVDKFTNARYDLEVTGLAGEDVNMNVYLGREHLNEALGYAESYFNGYVSNDELALDARYLASDLTPEAISSSADQMEDSMGQIADMMVVMIVPIYLVLMYLLTKTAIERSERSISYMKVFGYHSREISGIFVRSITVTVVVSLVISLPIVMWLVKVLIMLMMSEYAGNINMYTAPADLAKIVGIGVAIYGVVAVLHLIKIARIPLALALKVQE